MSTTTTNLGLTLPTPNVDSGWGSTLNTDFTLIDNLFTAAGTGTSVGINIGSGKTAVLGGTLLLGTGDGTGTVAAGTVRGPARTGTNVAGTDITFDASNGTGTGGSGKFIFRTAPASGSSSTANTFRSAFEVNSSGALGINGGDYGTVNQVLISAGTGAPASWSDVDGTVISIADQDQGDILYYDGGEWQRLPAGTSGQVLKTNGVNANPAWTTILSQSAAQTFASSGNSFTGIPSSAKSVVLSIYACDPSGTSDVLVRVGPSSGFLTTGYTSASSLVSSGASSAVATNGFLINSNGAGFNGTVRLTNISGNLWVCDYVLASYGSTRTVIGGGAIDVGGSLERIQIIPSSGTFATSGSASISYM